MIETATERAAVLSEAPEHKNDAVRRIVSRITALRLG